MVFSNKEGVSKLRRTLLFIGLCWLIALVVFLFMELFTVLAILAGLFLVIASLIALLNFQYIRIMVENKKLIVRYYSVFSVERMFQTIEFPVDQLRNVEVYKHFLGLKWDVRFTIRVKKGMADYPPVSFSAIPFKERTRLVMELKNLVPKNVPF